MAQLAALYFIHHHNTVPMVVTFGSPKIGNAEFTERIYSLIKQSPIRSEWYRVTNYKDPIPWLPLSEGWSHIGREIYVDHQDKIWMCAYKNGTMDPHCSMKDVASPFSKLKSVATDMVSEHNVYLNNFFGIVGCGGHHGAILKPGSKGK